MVAGTYQDEEALGKAPLGSLMVRMAIPSIAAQIINMLYNVVDRIYIGHIEGAGQMALTGVGVTFPILTLMSAFSTFAGQGGAPLAAIRLGAGEREEAERILGNSMTLMLLLAAGLTVFFSLFKVPVLMAFGASPDTIGYAVDYISIYLLGTVFVQLSLGLNPFIRTQGKTLIAMFSVLIGAVLNIALDPLFIFVFHWGVKGAAIATVLSQMVSALWVLGFLCSRRSSLRLKRSNLALQKQVMQKIFGLGIAPFIMRSTESLVSVVLNSGLQVFGGDLYVGALTIMQSAMQMVVMTIHGITDAAQPISGYNFGAGNYRRVRQVFLRLLAATLSVSVTACLLGCLFPRSVATLFNDDAALVELVGRVMPIFFGGVWAFGLQMACQTTFVALGQSKTSMFLACLRKLILLVPLAVVLPRVTGDVVSIYVAEPIADIVAGLVAVSVFLFRRKTLLPVEGFQSK